MAQNQYLNRQEFVNNVSKRLPVCIVVDVSNSMKFYDDTSISRIDRVNAGIEKFYNQCLNDPKTRNSVEVMIIEAGNDIKVTQDFTPVTQKPTRIVIDESVKCDLAEGMSQAYLLLEQRKKLLHDNQIKYWQPWLMVMSDGDANGGENPKERFNNIANLLIEKQNQEKLTVFSVFVQEKPVYDSKKDVYTPLLPKTYEKRLNGMKRLTTTNVINIDVKDMESFEYLFNFLHRSASSIANNRGLINDEKYGNYQKANIDNSTLFKKPLYDDNSNKLKDSKDTNSKINLSKKPTNNLSQFESYKGKAKQEEEIEEEKPADVVPTQKISEYQLYINNEIYNPIKKYLENEITMVFDCKINDAVSLLKDNKEVFNATITIEGQYTLTINEKEIALIPTKPTKRHISYQNKSEEDNEIKKAIKNITNWDEI